MTTVSSIAGETGRAIESLLASDDEQARSLAWARLKALYVQCTDDTCDTVREVASAALPRLSDAIVDDDAAIRAMACRGMGFFAPDTDESHITLLVAALDDPVLEVRLEALDALGEHRPDATITAVPRATRIVLHGATAEERRRAASLLREHGWTRRVGGFINVDLDLRTPEDPAPFVQAMDPGASPIHEGRYEGLHHVVLELPGSPDDAEAAVLGLAALVRALPAGARGVWDRATSRTFDVGLQAPQEHAIGSALSADALRAVAELGAQLVVTVYPPEPDEPALSQGFGGVRVRWPAPTRDGEGWTARIEVIGPDGAVHRRSVPGATAIGALIGAARLVASLPAFPEFDGARSYDPSWHVVTRHAGRTLGVGPVVPDGDDCRAELSGTRFGRAMGVGPVDAVVNACHGLVLDLVARRDPLDGPTSFAAVTRAVWADVASLPSAGARCRWHEDLRITELGRPDRARPLRIGFGAPRLVGDEVRMPFVVRGRTPRVVDLVGDDALAVLREAARLVNRALRDPGVVYHTRLAPWPGPTREEAPADLVPLASGRVRPDEARQDLPVTVYEPVWQRWSTGQGWVLWLDRGDERGALTGVGPVQALEWLEARLRTSDGRGP